MPRGRGFRTRSYRFCRRYPLLQTGSIPMGTAYPKFYPMFSRGGNIGYNRW
jgi:hypothetical protein